MAVETNPDLVLLEGVQYTYVIDSELNGVAVAHHYEVTGYFKSSNNDTGFDEIVADGGSSDYVVIDASHTQDNITADVTVITETAFANDLTCAEITCIKIPSTVKTIESGAFSGCSALTKVYYTGTIEEWNNISIADGNNQLLNATLYNYNGTALLDPLIYKLNADGVSYCVTGVSAEFTSGAITIPSTHLGKPVTKIADEAFRECHSLTGITIPNSITSIGNYAFYGCLGLTSVIIPNSVTTLGHYSFSACTSLTSVALPTSITSYHYSEFNNCDKLESVYYQGTLEQWCQIDYPYSGTIGGPLDNQASLYIKGELLTVANIPNTITEIKEHAFQGCTSLLKIIIPSSVTKIGSRAFEYCGNLQRVELTPSTVEIGSYAFGTGEPPIEDVYYSGTLDQWKNNVVVGTGNTKLTGSTLHYYSEPQRVANPKETCTTAGSYDDVVYWATDSGISNEEVSRETGVLTIPATGHTEVIDSAVAPTCTKTGLTEGTKCSVCGEIITPQHSIPITHTSGPDGVCLLCGVRTLACKVEFDDEWIQESEDCVDNEVRSGCHWNYDRIFYLTYEILDSSLTNRRFYYQFGGHKIEITPTFKNNVYTYPLRFSEIEAQIPGESILDYLDDSGVYLIIKAIVEAEKGGSVLSAELNYRYDLKVPPQQPAILPIELVAKNPGEVKCSWSQPDEDYDINEARGYCIEIFHCPECPEGEEVFTQLNNIRWNAEKLTDEENQKYYVEKIPEADIQRVTVTEVDGEITTFVFQRPNSELYIENPEVKAFYFMPKELGINPGDKYLFRVHPYNVYSSCWTYDEEGNQRLLPGTLLTSEGSSMEGKVSKGIVRVKTADSWVEGQVWVMTENGWKQAEAVYAKTENGWKEAQ